MHLSSQRLFCRFPAFVHNYYNIDHIYLSLEYPYPCPLFLPAITEERTPLSALRR